MNGPSAERRLSKVQLAAEFGVCVRTVQTWLTAGCPHLRAGGLLWFKLGEVEEWMRLQGRERSARGTPSGSV